MGIPQRPFFSTQDVVSPDINLYYTKVIRDIDTFRSTFNGTTSNLSQTISMKNLDNVFANNEANSVSAQESRCSAFFRMIGFPVLSGDGANMYSPGFDPDINRDKDRIQKNMDVANSAIAQLKTIFNARENYPKNSVNIFKNKTDSATALAISSIYVRPFEKQFKQGLDPLQIDTQEFTVAARSFVSADFADPVQFSTKSTHILKPFIVDPRIELTVSPAANRICAPFLLTKSKTQLSRSTFLKRPYIERVINVRFNNANVLAPPSGQDAINKFVTDLIDFVKVNSDITKPALVEITANSLNSLHKSEIMIFGKFVRILNALIKELAQAFININRIRQQINWKPIPSVNGPEFGSALNIVTAADTTNNKKVEVDISSLQIQKFLDDTDFDIGLNSPDLGNFSFSNIDDIVFGSLKNVPKFYDKQLTTLTRQRNEAGATANDLLKKIEIITGEFSGLGLLDVIAIQAALWIIKPEALVGLIDDAAVERMQSINKLKSDLTLPGNRLGPKAALTEFEKKLSEIYVLIGAFYQDIFDSSGKNNQ